MRRIDKTLKLATKYHQWLETLEQNEDTPQKKYDSSHPFHKDVLMNLIACQRGLCAYTETIVGDEKMSEEAYWKDGRYDKEGFPPETIADIDHFDPQLKKIKGWEWGNLFAVSSAINQRVKRDQPIDPILKPDLEEYDPFELLDYVAKVEDDNELTEINHRYVPHPSLSEDIKQRVLKMINILGINHRPICLKRMDAFGSIIESCNQFGVDLPTKPPTREFPTAWEMIKRSIVEKPL